jgi:hypothetical protein
MSEQVYTVAALIAEINTLFEQGFSGVQVEGEVTNASTSGRGHIYFTLKDDTAALDCVIWSSRARRLKFELEGGLAVLARGSLTIYAQRGRFQMVVEDVQPQGVGALQLAFEQLKKKLEAEGLFAAERKRDLPPLPNRIGIVTSATGAALQASSGSSGRAGSMRSLSVGAAAASRISGHSMKKRSQGLLPRARCRWSRASVTRSISRSPISSPTSEPPPRPGRPS